MDNIYKKTERAPETSRESCKTSQEKTSLGRINPPRAITSAHNFSAFCSGEQSMDDWLKKRALKNHQNDFSSVFVVTHDDNMVIGYYALSSYSVTRQNIPDMRNAPDPIPAVLLGRLAVDKKYQGQGLGESLLRDALTRIISAKQDLAIKVIVVHALNERVVGYYKKLRFESFTSNNMTLYVTIKDLEETYRTL